MFNDTTPTIIDWARGAPIAYDSTDKGPVVAAIGNFDGVHKGHQHLISVAKMMADDLDLPLAILTFSPHPRAFFRPQDPAFLLMNETQKQGMLAHFGADMIVNIAFDEALRTATPEEFASEVLQPLGIVHLFAGRDFAFGKARSGDVKTLARLGAAFDMQVTGVTLELDEHQMVISSSRIRAALQAGQVDLAQHMLGRPHLIQGAVATGDQRGRTIGFPTANIQLTTQLQPAFGVYAITAQLANDPTIYQGVANIGMRPTVNDRGVLAEAHLFDFNKDIYGQQIEIALQGYVRAEMKFSGIEALTAQIKQDAITAQQILADLR